MCTLPSPYIRGGCPPFDFNLDEDDVLISFDVVSMYTFVPVHEAIKEAANWLYSGEFEVSPVSKETFVKLLQLSSTDVAMATHDGYYVQKDGFTMGSTPAPHLANISLANKETQIKDDAKLFERYMDDIIRTIKVKDIDDKLTETNNLHPNLSLPLNLRKMVKYHF